MLQPAVVLRDPDLIKDVLVRDWNSFHANDFPVDLKFNPLAAVNSFFNMGEAWKRVRNILGPILFCWQGEWTIYWTRMNYNHEGIS